MQMLEQSVSLKKMLFKSDRKLIASNLQVAKQTKTLIEYLSWILAKAVESCKLRLNV